MLWLSVILNGVQRQLSSALTPSLPSCHVECARHAWGCCADVTREYLCVLAAMAGQQLMACIMCALLLTVQARRSTHSSDGTTHVDGVFGRAVVLEMIGDLPEADAKPPENMLFVCKLNQVRRTLILPAVFPAAH